MENKYNFKPFDKVLVRDKDTNQWQIDLFELNETGNSRYKYKCLNSSWVQCIPYDGNEHLLGTTDSPQKEEEQEEKQDEVTADNYGYDSNFFKGGDIVLVRSNVLRTWRAERFVKYENGKYAPFVGVFGSWKECVPFDGNQNLLGTDDYPESYNQNKNTLFGVRLKPGYVLEFEDEEIGILFPTANGFAVSYAKGLWQFLKGIKKDSIVRILGITKTDYLRSGELLWKKPKKQTFTKSEIAERLNMNVQDFEIFEEDNEENE
jgi:hypothetical protein